MAHRWKLILTLFVVTSASQTTLAEVRLLGITGVRGADVVDDAHTLFEIDPDNAASTTIKQLSYIQDAHVIGFNPNDGLIYHFAGGEAWTDNPDRIGGFRDHHYLETYNLETGELTAVFNANSEPSPDDYPAQGLPAPMPDFVLPQEQRLVDDPAPRERGENEYHALRHLAWSDSEQLWYATDELGIFTITPTGESTYIGQPVEDSSDLKGLAFYTDGTGETRLLAGTKKNPNLWTIDPSNGDVIGDPVVLEVPADNDFDDEFLGLVAMAQHPETGVLYGVRNHGGDNDLSFERELVTIDPDSGETTLIGNLGLEIASIVFVESGLPGDFNGNGSLDAGDLDVLAQYMTTQDLAGDIQGDGTVNLDDRIAWVATLQKSWLGDSNFDGEFNSGDFVAVFTVGKYETNENATYAEGDWDGNGKFDSGDFVAAFSVGGYEQGRLPASAAVPEPGGASLLLLGMLAIGNRARRSGGLTLLV